MKPITPSQARKSKICKIPSVVIKAVNNLIATNLKGDTATVLLKDIVKEVRRLNPEMTSTLLYENGWLDFESIFEKNGWKVYYDRPGYCESYEASFEFTAKRGAK
jgi:hypothetical protein